MKYYVVMFSGVGVFGPVYVSTDHESAKEYVDAEETSDPVGVYYIEEVNG